MSRKRRKFRGMSWRVVKEADGEVLVTSKGTIKSAREAAKGAVKDHGQCKAQMFAGNEWVTVGVANG